MNLQIKFDITVLFLCRCFCLGLNGLICFCLGVTCVTFLCIRLLIHSIHNLLRWSFFTFIFNCSSEMNYFIYFTFTLQSYTLPSLSLCASSCSASNSIHFLPRVVQDYLLKKNISTLHWLPVIFYDGKQVGLSFVSSLCMSTGTTSEKSSCSISAATTTFSEKHWF